MPDRVLAAASTQLRLVGPDALTVEAIAERAHVSVGFVYKHFASLNAIVRDVVNAELPHAIANIPTADALPTTLLVPPATSSERMPLEALLCLRRFPDTKSVVEPIITEFAQRAGPLRCAVILGCQAITLAGVTIPTADVKALISLEARARGGFGHVVMTGPPALVAHYLTKPHPTPERSDPTAVRLRDATCELLTETFGRASLRDIAKKAGVTTGAVYRRYGSKDELIGDTIKSAVAANRTDWLEQFFAALMDRTRGEPALILARVLATASTPGTEQARQSIELLVAARSGPAARAALSQHYLAVVETRKAQFRALATTGLTQDPNSPAALAWALEVAPMGARLTCLATAMPNADGWFPPMASVLRAV